MVKLKESAGTVNEINISQHFDFQILCALQKSQDLIPLDAV
jgi:hypothetical protein